MSTMEKRLLTVREASDLMGFSESTIKRWVRDGELSSIKEGKLRRIPRAAIEAWFEERVRAES